jgi:acetolactate synthase-1/2/3 large subunit
MTGHRNGGAAVVQTLAAHGVDTIFGIPGTHNLEIYRHLPTTGIRAVTPRHEQGAGYAAEAFARVTGRPGVVVTTSGPGLTNVMTAASTAYAESQPMLVLSSVLPTGAEGRDLGQLHEAKNPLGAMGQLVRWSRRVAGAVIGWRPRCCCLRWSRVTMRLRSSSSSSCRQCWPAWCWPR